MARIRAVRNNVIPTRALTAAFFIITPGRGTVRELLSVHIRGGRRRRRGLRFIATSCNIALTGTGKNCIKVCISRTIVSNMDRLLKRIVMRGMHKNRFAELVHIDVHLESGRGSGELWVATVCFFLFDITHVLLEIAAKLNELGAFAKKGYVVVRVGAHCRDNDFTDKGVLLCRSK